MCSYLIKVNVPKIRTKKHKIAAGLTSESAILANVLKMYTAINEIRVFKSSGLLVSRVNC